MRFKEFMTEQEVRYTSDGIVRALNDGGDGLEDNEKEVIEHIVDRIEQSFPNEITFGDIKDIIRETGTRQIEKDNQADTFELVNYILTAAGYDDFR